jgi:transposase
MYIGTDLHKHQFTCCYLKEKETHMAQFATNEAGYEGFKRDICRMKEEGYQVRVAVESTGNTRYFKNRIEALGVEVVVVNTLRFKVVVLPPICQTIFKQFFSHFLCDLFCTL